jgi:hypothetical protein
VDGFFFGEGEEVPTNGGGEVRWEITGAKGREDGGEDGDYSKIGHP